MGATRCMTGEFHLALMSGKPSQGRKIEPKCQCSMMLTRPTGLWEKNAFERENRILRWYIREMFKWRCQVGGLSSDGR